jgi:uncharacterized protein YbaR (Trm112 family)
MRLYAHNLLACLKCQSFPLELGPNTEIAPTGDDYDEDFTKRMLVRLEYKFLKSAFETLKQQHPAILGQHNIPATIDEVSPDDVRTLKTIYYIMSGFAVKTGTLHCTHCQSIYNIVDFIPVMLPENKQ